jgi:hypothetical protein
MTIEQQGALEQAFQTFADAAGETSTADLLTLGL